MHRIAIFASGTGSNARKIIEYFKNKTDITVSLVLSNKANAPVLDMARDHGIDTLTLTRKEFYETEHLLAQLHQHAIDFIVLAGFLWLVPSYLVRAYPQKIVNIHPALLPKYGGKGMYGHWVHEAVKAAAEPESGMTIHFVNEAYDEGAIIFQSSCRLDPEDDPETIAKKVLRLEHEHFAPVIEQLILKQER
ncbi:phosphoribosylglycinamide formyltransferase [Flavilitoribacter nigricans]|uniref:Phosphoribosylglycinamide formyltransferase n=1 Tax=Flavilitoribacter nigricans (strain ATCC 23147 / DSM 23189 / NBRC 102662 / NCIMB 1420 / SS-2) TaxID=1122177 RepID=A0A2D0N421_FLAN2|nr:phosphoribosylglycinamide formyltransferase [Flavilitoribacter nigricans]PHN03245.1 phosphoribosylglycinamide formyltransferase [Flavilitoribacter nigricans DSM 23189 = NBRC 102662]